MAEPQSIKNEPFTDFPRQAYSVINDDFCHEKNLVTKISAKTSKSVIKIKESITNKKEKWSVADEVKLWFDLPNNRSLYAKVKSSDYIKVHYDHGVREWQNKKYNVFGSLNCNKVLKNLSLKLGVANISEKCTSENRIRCAVQQDSQEWSYANRTTVNHNKLTFGLVAVFDITNKVLQKNNLLFGYKADSNTNLFLRAENAGFRKENVDSSKMDKFFDSITADVVRKIDDKSKAGFEASYDVAQRKVSNVSAVYQRELKPKEMVKFGLNNNLDVSVVYKRPIVGLENLGTISIGGAVSGIKDNKLSVKHGFELGINL